MDQTAFPTKGNLILAKNTLQLSRQGYDLLDRKRNVLIKEIMELNEKAKDLQGRIDSVFTEAYAALQAANIDMGISNVERFSYGVPQERTIRLRSRSVMGVEIPIVSYDNSTVARPSFGFINTTSAMDDAYAKFNEVKDLVITLAQVENSAYRLAMAIKQTQKRANALKNITIPKFESLVKHIQDTLEEHDRDEFTRLKVIKRTKEDAQGA
ncbi:MAG: V-type ATP synthase subunit D [Defluviitaleaceae bacterium]|nr:V-type ATP synthase subunit D [Defluviitaleaceae bacterium]